MKILVGVVLFQYTDVFALLLVDDPAMGACLCVNSTYAKLDDFVLTGNVTFSIIFY